MIVDDEDLLTRKCSSWGHFWPHRPVRVCRLSVVVWNIHASGTTDLIHKNPVWKWFRTSSTWLNLNLLAPKVQKLWHQVFVKQEFFRSVPWFLRCKVPFTPVVRFGLDQKKKIQFQFWSVSCSHRLCTHKPKVLNMKSGRLTADSFIGQFGWCHG